MAAETATEAARSGSLAKKRRLGVPGSSILTALAVTVLGVYVIAGVCGDLITPHNASTIGIGPPLASPGHSYLLGTDELGRDVLSRLMLASRIALLAAVESVGLAAVIGCALGVTGAYFGGGVDFVALRFGDILFSMPEFLLAVVVIAALGPGLSHATLAIAIVYTPRFMRIARVQAVSVMASGYVDAARLAGRRGLYIVLRHVIPNIVTPVIVLITLSMASAQLTYSALSFLGFGARPPTPDYGQMLANARLYMIQDPLLVIAPAVALTVLILAFNMVGDALRDKWDPRNVTR